VAVKKSRFLESIERARAAASLTARPAQKPVEEMTSTELDEQMRLAKLEVVEANRALAAAVAEEHVRPPATLGATLAELQRGKRRHWR
jgi:hypothetical protein